MIRKATLRGEQRRQHLGRAVVTPRLLHSRRRRRHDLARLRGTQQERDKDHHEALPKAEPQECRFIAARLDHVGDRDYGQRRAGAEAGRSQPGRKAPPIRKPLQRVADRSAVNHSGADAADRGADIEQEQGVGHGVDHPGDPTSTPLPQTITRGPNLSIR